MSIYFLHENALQCICSMWFLLSLAAELISLNKKKKAVLKHLADFFIGQHDKEIFNKLISWIETHETETEICAFETKASNVLFRHHPRFPKPTTSLPTF